jgi:hypothetical protein
MVGSAHSMSATRIPLEHGRMKSNETPRNSPAPLKQLAPLVSGTALLAIAIAGGLACGIVRDGATTITPEGFVAVPLATATQGDGADAGGDGGDASTARSASAKARGTATSMRHVLSDDDDESDDTLMTTMMGHTSYMPPARPSRPPGMRPTGSAPPFRRP